VLGRISFLTIITIVSGCAAPAPKAVAPSEPPALPLVELETLEGTPARLPHALEGKVALVSLWATWCEACVQEVDALGRLDEKVRALGATVIAVDQGEPRDTVSAFVKQRNLRYMQLLDEQFRLGDALGHKRVPTTLVVDKSGRITHLGGALDESALSALRNVLGERTALR
jgi:peroxiredoxin